MSQNNKITLIVIPDSTAKLFRPSWLSFMAWGNMLIHRELLEYCGTLTNGSSDEERRGGEVLIKRKREPIFHGLTTF